MTIPVGERPAADVGLEEELRDAALEGVVGGCGLVPAAGAAEEDAAAAGARDGGEEGAEAVPAAARRLRPVQHGHVRTLHRDQLPDLDRTAGHAVAAARLLMADRHRGGEGGKVRVRIRKLRKLRDSVFAMRLAVGLIVHCTGMVKKLGQGLRELASS